MLVDRRRKRSNYTGLALQYWFSAVAQRTRLFGIVLGDSAGLLVASSLRGPEAEEIAALAPLLARPDKEDGANVPVSIRRLKVDRTSLFLCAIGDQTNQRDRGLKWAESGIQRILMTH